MYLIVPAIAEMKCPFRSGRFTMHIAQVCQFNRAPTDSLFTYYTYYVVQSFPAQMNFMNTKPTKKNSASAPPFSCIDHATYYRCTRSFPLIRSPDL